MSRGQSAQRPPHFSAWTIPLSTRRSSTRLLPRAFAGSSGSIRAHCASENQKKSAIDAASSLKAVNNKSGRSEEHTSELQSLMRISYAVFCLKTKKQHTTETQTN